MRSPPLWCLPVAAGIVAELLLLVFPGYLHDRESVRRAWPRIIGNAIALDPEESLPPDGRRPSLVVLGLGTSLLCCATEHDQLMEVLASKEGKRPLHFREICGGGTDWDSLPLLEAACAGRPKVLLVESNLLFFRNPSMYAEASRGGAFLDYARFRVLRDFLTPAGSRPPVWPVEFLTWPSSDPVRVAMTPALLAQTLEFRVRNFHPEDLGRYLKPLRKAHEAGVTIVILDLTITPAPLVFSPAQRGAIDGMHEVLKREAGALIWRCPLKFEDSDFYDTAHLAPGARARFSRWLVGELDALPIK